MTRTNDSMDQENLKELLKSGDATAITLYYISRDVSALSNKFDDLQKTFASQESVNSIDKRVTGLEGSINKGVWIVLSALLLGIVNLLIKMGAKFP